jgi:serpin B
MSPKHPLTGIGLLLLSLPACGGSSGSPRSSTAPVEDKSNVARVQASAIPTGDVSAAVQANNAFAVDLYAHVRQHASPGNLFTSPLSASLALTMTYAGAKGETASQMASALHLGSSASVAFAGQNALDEALESRAAAALAADAQTAKDSGQPTPSPSDYDLHIVNSVWGEQAYEWAQPFLDVLAADYGTGVYLEDFVHQFESARTAINDWVSQETSDKINDLLPQGALDGSTRMVLVNAVHLKLPWLNAFAPSRTQNATFTRGDGSGVTVPMMQQTQELGYTDDGQAQIVSLPLAGESVAVVIALPHGDLASYEGGLTATSAALVPPAASTSVVLSLPRVSFTSQSFSLAKSLQAMGMVDAFDPNQADLTGLCPKTADGERLFVSDVLQKAMIGIQETGVEAAAATAVTLAGSAEPTKMVTMTVNRPYLVSIVDVPTGAVLFVGHIEDPTQSGG